MPLRQMLPLWFISQRHHWSQNENCGFNGRVRVTELISFSATLHTPNSDIKVKNEVRVHSLLFGMSDLTGLFSSLPLRSIVVRTSPLLVSMTLISSWIPLSQSAHSPHYSNVTVTSESSCRWLRDESSRTQQKWGRRVSMWLLLWHSYLQMWKL